MSWFDDDNPYATEQRPEECRDCRHLRLEGPGEREFVVAPINGGGWPEWSFALLRLLQRMSAQPTQALIITQDSLTSRYVQVLIGHGIAHVEASSNVYLEGSSLLEAEHEELLTLLGWQPPGADRDDPDRLPANWSLPLVRGDWAMVTELLSATVIGVFGFSEFLPTTIRTFLCDSPCKACSWPDESMSHAPC